MFDAVENEQEFENALTDLTAFSDLEDDTVFAKEASLNEIVEIPF